MKKIPTKDEVLSTLMEARQNIVREVSTIPDTEQDRIFMGIWSIKDLLAHLAGWDYTNNDAVRELIAGTLPTFYRYHDKDWQTYNAKLVATYKRDSLEELLTLIRGSQQQLMEFLATIPSELFPKDFGVRFRGYKVTIQRLLEAETKDEQIHYEQIKQFLERSR